MAIRNSFKVLLLLAVGTVLLYMVLAYAGKTERALFGQVQAVSIR